MSLHNLTRKCSGNATITPNMFGKPQLLAELRAGCPFVPIKKYVRPILGKRTPNCGKNGIQQKWKLKPSEIVAKLPKEFVEMILLMITNGGNSKPAYRDSRGCLCTGKNFKQTDYIIRPDVSVDWNYDKNEKFLQNIILVPMQMFGGNAKM